MQYKLLALSPMNQSASNAMGQFKKGFLDRKTLMEHLGSTAPGTKLVQGREFVLPPGQIQKNTLQTRETLSSFKSLTLFGCIMLFAAQKMRDLLEWKQPPKATHKPG